MAICARAAIVHRCGIIHQAGEEGAQHDICRRQRNNRNQNVTRTCADQRGAS